MSIGKYYGEPLENLSREKLLECIKNLGEELKMARSNLSCYIEFNKIKFNKD